MNAITTGYITADGLRVYDLDPQASELWAFAGPDGYDPADIETDELPTGFRWVEAKEWQSLVASERLRTKHTQYTIQYDDSGCGHDWRTIDEADWPASILDEVYAEILDGRLAEREVYVARNGQHFRWVA